MASEQSNVPPLDQFWECPRCGSQIAAGRPAELGPPTCIFGHMPVEMEQVTAPRFGGRINA